MKHPWEFDETRFGFAGRRVLVTGAAGVLGYELCRQLVTEHAPALLRLFDQNESGLFHADQALRMLDAPTARERDVLGAFGYSRVDAASGERHIEAAGRQFAGDLGTDAR